MKSSSVVGRQRKLSGIIVAVVVSQSAWPTLYFVSKYPRLTEPTTLVSTGFVCLLIVAYLLKLLLPPRTNIDCNSENQNVIERGLLYYSCCLFSFSCIVDAIFYLEKVGKVEGFIGFYLKTGEPYFETSYGTFSLLWDGAVNFLIYMVIIYQIDNHLDCRNLVIYWGGTMVVSLFTLLYGAAAGDYGSKMHLASMLNIPYIVIPIHYLVKFMLLPRDYPKFHTRKFTKALAPLDMLMDVTLLAGLLVTTLFGVVRGLAALNSPSPLAVEYAHQYEPYVLEPSKFGSAWILYMMTIGSLFQIVLMHGLFTGNAKWMVDWSLLYFSMTAYGTYVHLLPQFSSGVKPQYHIPEQHQLFVVVTNLLIPLVAGAVFIRSYALYMGNRGSAAENAKAE